MIQIIKLTNSPVLDSEIKEIEIKIEDKLYSGLIMPKEMLVLLI